MVWDSENVQGRRDNRGYRFGDLPRESSSATRVERMSRIPVPPHRDILSSNIRGRLGMRYALRTTCATLLFTFAALGQNSNGRISGTVSDSSGAVVPRAAVTITNQDTRLTWKAITDNAGYYVVTSLPVGTYNVQVQARGMRKAEKTGY